MKTAVVFWSGTGNTEAMAQSVANGVKAAGAEVDVLTCDQFNETMIDDYDSIAFGCPSMGTEELEEGEFEPMFSAVKNRLNGKKIVLFGSYGWGDGEWMRNWEDDCKKCGAVLAAESVICNDAPDDDVIAQCETLGAALV